MHERTGYERNKEERKTERRKEGRKKEMFKTETRREKQSAWLKLKRISLSTFIREI
jgi:hypothetical protein